MEALEIFRLAMPWLGPRRAIFAKSGQGMVMGSA